MRGPSYCWQSGGSAPLRYQEHAVSAGRVRTGLHLTQAQGRSLWHSHWSDPSRPFQQSEHPLVFDPAGRPRRIMGPAQRRESRDSLADSPNLLHLVQDSCSSGRGCAYGFLQIPRCHGHPCLQLAVLRDPARRNLHSLALIHAGRNPVGGGVTPPSPHTTGHAGPHPAVSCTFAKL